MVYEADDEEADRIYESIDEKMDERRRARREKREQEEQERLLKERPTIQSQFADLKRNLEAMTEDDWLNLPEVSNLVGKHKRPKVEGPRSYVVPDSVILGAHAQNQTQSTLDAETMAETPVGSASGGKTDFAEIGAARVGMLSVKLEQMEAGTDSTIGSTNIDPKGYLTGLQSQVLKTDAEIG